MNFDFENCPYCGRKILKGALRCLGCGKILKTPEEQADSIKKLRESRKRSDTVRFLKLLAVLVFLIVIYIFSDRILEFVNKFINK